MNWRWRSSAAKAAATGLFCAGLALSQAPEPKGAGLEPGRFPAHWITGGPDCAAVPKWQVHAYNPDLYIIRESGCTNYEKPFLYLFFGKDRALLQDTGAGETNVAEVVNGVVAEWCKRNGRASIPLVVAHSHGHGDHISGDAQFKDKPGVTLIGLSVEATQQAFSIANWPTDRGSIDLGGRVLDVIPIPGHQPFSVAFYDRRTGILLTGDTLYPGRLYVSDFPAFAASIQRLVDFTRDKPVAHILGCHIEESNTPFLDYVVRTQYQPEEHVLELSHAHLVELNEALKSMDGHPARYALRDFTIWPK
ncbi:MAG TPA: MBL fold metallo-hydrolase [Bryobacteraceae bacterium]|nr:MBL fold metallo-hydrolase [Bryobacteraceae bacterium]